MGVGRGEGDRSQVIGGGRMGEVSMSVCVTKCMGGWVGGRRGGLIGDGISARGASCLRAPYGFTTSPLPHLWLCVLRMNPCYSAIVTVA